MPAAAGAVYKCAFGSCTVQYSSKVPLPDENYLNVKRLGSYFYCT